MNLTDKTRKTKALVAVIEDVATAQEVLAKLYASGFPLESMELVTDHVRDEAPEVETPKVHETTASSMAESAGKWGSVGAGAGLLAGITLPFPGIALGMALVGGVVGAVTGGIAGIEHAVEDDAVDLPTLDQYEHLIKQGHCLIVVQGSHDEVMIAEAIVKEVPYINRHVYKVLGHKFHEHPARKPHK